MNNSEIKYIYCEICEKECHENNFFPECKHYFCFNCVKENFLHKLTISNKNTKFKCLLSRCQNEFSKEQIETIIKKDRDLSQISYWNQIESIPNVIPCPYQNCNSYSILKENLNHESDKKSNIDEHSSINYKNINTSIHDFDIILEEKPIILECQNKHKFCSNCLLPEHGEKKCYDKTIFIPSIIYKTQEEIYREIYVRNRGRFGGRKCTYILDGCCLECFFDKCIKLPYFKDMYECCETDHSFIQVLIKLLVLPFILCGIFILSSILLIFPNFLIIPFITANLGKKISSKNSIPIYALTVFFITMSFIAYNILFMIFWIIITCICYDRSFNIDDFPVLFLYCHCVLICFGGDGLIEDDD